MVEVGARMVAAQLLLMNHFLMSLSHNSPDFNSFHNINSVALDVGECSYGCTKCSPINGCLACKPPFFLLLHREGMRQTASCTRSCPRGFYKLKKKRNGFCAKCTMRGCVDCLDSRYCSSCDTAFINFFGKCIKQRSGEGREDLGLYTTRRPGDYSTTTEVGEGTKVNGTSPSPEGSWNLSSTSIPTSLSTLEAFAVPQSTPVASHTTLARPTSPPVAAATTSPSKVVLQELKTSPPRNPGTSPAIATRFYFTTPTSPLLSENSASGISPYPSPTVITERKPCQRKSDRRLGRPKGDRKDKKERRDRKKIRRDRKYRRRKGRKGQKNRRRGCRRRAKNRRTKTSKLSNEDSLPSTRPSQDPAMRQLNSAEPREELKEKFPLHGSRGSILGTSNSAAPAATDGIKVSLLEGTDSLSLTHKRHEGWSKDLTLHFRNRPRSMVAFKRSLALRKKKKKKRKKKKRKTESLFHDSHRVRHGRLRDIPTSEPRIGEPLQFKKKLRTKSGRRRRGRKRIVNLPSSITV